MYPIISTLSKQTSHAILLLADCYILQLRDKKPSIPAAGKWSLFGGKKKGTETSLDAIRREISEELSIRPDEFRYLWFEDYYSGFEKVFIRTHFFVSVVDKVWSKYKLMEGQDVGIFTYKQILELDMPPLMKQMIFRFHKMTWGNI